MQRSPFQDRTPPRKAANYLYIVHCIPWHNSSSIVPFPARPQSDVRCRRQCFGKREMTLWRASWARSHRLSVRRLLASPLLLRELLYPCEVSDMTLFVPIVRIVDCDLRLITRLSAAQPYTTYILLNPEIESGRRRSPLLLGGKAMTSRVSFRVGPASKKTWTSRIGSRLLSQILISFC